MPQNGKKKSTEFKPFDISVIVPYYNSRETLGECISGLAKLSPGPREIILVDNNSTDGSGKLVSDLLLKYPDKNFKHIGEEKPGPSAARNAGCNRAKGKLLAFTDSDVIVPSNWINNILSAHNHRKGKMGAGKIIPSNPQNTTQKFLSAFTLRTPETELISEQFNLTSGGFPAANLWIEAEALRKAGGWDESLRIAEDYDLEARVYEKGFRLHYNPSVSVTHIHRKRLRNLIRQSINYGAGRPVMMKRYFPNLLLISLLGREFRCKFIKGVWIDLNGLDKKVLVMIILGLFYTPLFLLLPLYLLVASLRMKARAKKIGLIFSLIEHFTMPFLMLIKACSMSWGALRNSFKRRVFCI